MKKFFSILSLLSLTGLTTVFSQIPTNGLVGYYPFNGNANDMSGNGYNGTVNGATLTTDRFGNINNAYSFNGTSNYIDLSSYVSSFNIQQPAAISFWLKTNNDNGQSIFSISDAATGTNISMIAVGNNVTGTLTNEITVVSHHSSTSDYYIAGFTTGNRDTMLDNNWHHMVYLFDNISTRIFLDKRLLSVSCNYGTNNGHYGNLPNAAKVSIGTRYVSGYGAFYNGSLDDFRIYNRSLDSTEISALFNEGICYETVSVTDTLIINANLVGFQPVTYANTIKIYPNPTKDHIYIKSDNNSYGYQIKIINTLSQIVYQATINQAQYFIDLNTWSGNGTYFVQLYDSNGNLLEVRKIVLQ